MSKKPESIACAFGGWHRDLYAEGPSEHMAFASVHVSPDEAERLVEEAYPFLAFEMDPFGVELSYILGYHYAIEFLEKLNGRYSVTAVFPQWQEPSQNWTQRCLSQHAVAWAKRLGDIDLVCERHPQLDNFGADDLKTFSKAPRWYSAFHPGNRLPNVVGPVTFAAAADCASIAVARIVALIATQYLESERGNKTSWALAAHEISPELSIIESRFSSFQRDWGVAHWASERELRAAIESTGAMGFAAQCAAESRELVNGG